MKEKQKFGTGQLFNFAQGSYFERTSRPIYAVVFLLPFIAFYELGTILINKEVLTRYWQGRVVAFAWLERSLDYLGFGSKFAWVATPLAVIVILLALQVSSRKRWQIRYGDLWPMVIECIVFAVPLIVLGLYLNSPPKPQGDVAQFSSESIVSQIDDGAPSCSSVAGGNGGPRRPRLLADIVTGIGAGIYEELVFRLILICVLMMLFQDVLRLDHTNSIIVSVLVSAALFSAYHHIDFFSGQLYQRDPFSWTKFCFRTMAGVYFALLFAIRGFGITAGTHAFYDIIATCVNAFFFGAGN